MKTYKELKGSIKDLVIAATLTGCVWLFNLLYFITVDMTPHPILYKVFVIITVLAAILFFCAVFALVYIFMLYIGEKVNLQYVRKHLNLDFKIVRFNYGNVRKCLAEDVLNINQNIDDVTFEAKITEDNVIILQGKNREKETISVKMFLAPSDLNLFLNLFDIE